MCNRIVDLKAWWRWLCGLVPFMLLAGSIFPSSQVWGATKAANTAYRYAAGLFDMGEYELASQEFSAFILSFPEDSLAASAAYWMGGKFV